ncbi:hypothetical protein ACHAQA_001217 [Verticillium albo-atrum]
MAENPPPSTAGAAAATITPSAAAQPPQPLPRIAIQFCTQCKWMLRAAYFAQELLSTFSTSLGEVALLPSTGGTFTVTITTTNPTTTNPQDAGPSSTVTTTTKTLWDRKTDGGFPETKELKRRVRDVIDPARDLGHVDRDHARPAAAPAAPAPMSSAPTQEASTLDDGARERIAAARTNKGQAAPSAVDGAALVGELKSRGPGAAQTQTQGQGQAQTTQAPQEQQQADGKAACEDCA